MKKVYKNFTYCILLSKRFQGFGLMLDFEDVCSSRLRFFSFELKFLFFKTWIIIYKR